MKQFWKKKLPAALLVLALMASLVPMAAAANTCPDGQHRYVQKFNSENHWNECEVCGHKTAESSHKLGAKTVTTAPTCYSTGEETQTCSCGYSEKNTIPKIGHTVNSSWSHDANQHYHACKNYSNCAYREGAENHAWGALRTVNATCTADGRVEHTCTVCNATYTVTPLPKLGHSLDVNGRCTRCNQQIANVNITVTFQNGSSIFTTQTVTTGRAPSNPGTPIYPGTGNYRFLGWTTVNPGFSAAYNGQPYWTSAQVTAMAVTSNITYYALYDVKSSAITYTVRPGEKVEFDADDFNDVYQTDCDTSRDISWVEFDVSSSSFNSFEGDIYCGTTVLSRREFVNSAFYYKDSADGDYDLNQLYLTADKNADEDTLQISFAAYRNGNDYTEGTLELVIDEDGADEDITYTVGPGEEVEFNRRDFYDLFHREYPYYDLEYVTFDQPDSDAFSEGTLYVDYGSRSEESFSRNDLDEYDFYYSDSKYGDYELDELSFVADRSFDTPVTLSFRAYSGNRYVKGTVRIQTEKDQKASFEYTVDSDDEVEFDDRDFRDFFRKECNGYDLRYVIFNRPSNAAFADGTLYYDYSGKYQRAFTQNNLSSQTFYYDDERYGDYELDKLTFVTDRGFDTAVILPFRAYYDNNRYADGTVKIKPATETAAVKGGDIRYATTYSGRVQINANDVARFFNKTYPSDTLQYVTLGGIPDFGSLYYNYYGTSKYGATSSTRLTEDNCDDQNFYFSPSSGQYALGELTYVPSGINYCAAIPFTAYGTGSKSVSGSILVSVNLDTVSDVYGAIPRNSAVNFPADSIKAAVSQASGQSITGIRLLELPPVAAGTVYLGSGTAVRADTKTVYTYRSGTQQMNQLRFVPAPSYTGSVELPYVAYSGNNIIASGKLCLGIVNSVKEFKDVNASTWCYKYVVELSDAGVIDGYRDGRFRPDSQVTYGAALKLIMLAAGYPEQKPTTAGSVFSGYLSKAQADGLVSGNVDLNAPITRLAVSQIAAKAMKLNISNLSSLKPFTDTTDPYVQALNAAGIVEGYFSNGTSTFKPYNSLTRGQISAIIWRMERAG